MTTRPPATPLHRTQPQPRRPKTPEEIERADAEREERLRLEKLFEWGLPSGLLTTAEQIDDALDLCRRKGLIVPMADQLRAVQVEPYKGWRLTLVMLDEDAFWTHEPLDADGHRLEPVYRMKARTAMRLATLLPLTIQTVEHLTGSPRHVWSCTATAEMEMPNGRRAQDAATATVDLTDDSAEARRLGVDEIERARISGSRWAETRARGEVIRNLLGLGGDYGDVAISRPVVVFVPTRVLPVDDPVIDRALLLKAMGSAADLFGPAEAQVLGPRPGITPINLAPPGLLAGPVTPPAPPPPPPPPPPTYEECIDAFLDPGASR